MGAGFFECFRQCCYRKTVGITEQDFDNINEKELKSIGGIMMARLCLDHAHCESVEHGTSGRYAFESDIELAICQFAQEDLINIGHQVMLTKETVDSECTRLQMAIDWTAKIFLSTTIILPEKARLPGVLFSFSLRSYNGRDNWPDISFLGLYVRLIDCQPSFHCSVRF